LRGASITFDDTDPTYSLVYVESGTLTFTVAATVSVTRRAGATETVPAQTEFAAGPGDYFVIPAHAATTVRNDGRTAAGMHVGILYVKEPTIP
jgi:hypothetical protein